jgi:uncharacterized membrane protein
MGGAWHLVRPLPAPEAIGRPESGIGMAGTNGMTPDESSGDGPGAGVARPLGSSAAARVVASAVVGICAGLVASLPGTWHFGTLVGWDTAAAVYIAWTWKTIWRRDPVSTARLAVREDPGRAATDALLLVASVASILAVAIVITAGAAGDAVTRDAHAALAVASVALSWTVVQIVFTSRYARLYYSHPPGGINFNDGSPPRYSDFAYVAFTVGMTFQVSDTDLETSAFRSSALTQALLSYLFGAVILATIINLVAGLLR